ncbi:MAG: hypothetical protein L0154_11245 [Chloroflexi bacterium]|nr:hypothetical protein [Chloroflexota bacterium]
MSETTSKQRNFTRAQSLQLSAMQFLFFFAGLAFLILGGARIFLETSGGAVQEAAGQVIGPEFVTIPTFIGSIFLVLLGYALFWGWAALGAKEPPAWQIGRNGLIGFLVAITLMTAFVAIERPSSRVSAIIGWIGLAGLAAFLLYRFNDLDFRLALRAERLRKREIRIFTAFNIIVVLLISSLTVLGLVYAILTDVIELPVQDPEPNELLFVTNFDNFNDEWEIYPGRNSVEIQEDEIGNPRIVITVDSGIRNDGVFTFVNRKFGDFDLRVTATQLQSAPDHDNRFGVIFRHRDNENYYIFEISGDGWYRLVKVKEGKDEDISDWIPTTVLSDDVGAVNETLIRPGRENTIGESLDASNEIRIVGRDDKFWFYVNGQLLPLCQKGDNLRSLYDEDTHECVSDELAPYFQDNDFKQGRIGLSAGYTPSSSTLDPVQIAFDNLIIVGPDEPAPTLEPRQER